MSYQALIRIGGMTCSACSSSITNALNDEPGVIDVSISLLTEEGKIAYNSSEVNIERIIEVIEDCGFDASVITNDKSPDDQLIETVASITGMTCGSCSASITKALENIPGITSVSISLLTEEGKIIHESSVDDDTIIQTIENCGFEASITNKSPAYKSVSNRTKFGIVGMTCGACTASIKKTLESLPGVYEAEVSLIVEEALIIHDSSKASTETLKQAIEDSGFDANFIQTEVMDQSLNEEVEEVTLQIFGIDQSMDLDTFRYNLEANMSTLKPGIISYSLNLNKTHIRQVSEMDSNADLEHLQNEGDLETLENELSITYDSSYLGIRDIIEKLNSINSRLEFFIINSVDKLSNTQLKLLARVKEVAYWKKNFFHCLILGVPVFILSRTQSLKFFSNSYIIKGLFWTTLIQATLSTYIQFKLGITFYKKFIVFIKNKGMNATMDVLVCISTGISYFFSVLALIISVWNGNDKKPPTLLFETNAMIITYISLGKWFENKAKGQTSTALSKLLSLTPNTCTIVTNLEKYDTYFKRVNNTTNLNTEMKEIDLPEENFSTETIDINLIQKNDVCIVIPGSKIPSDGEIIFGESEVDESLITGETLPVYKTCGDVVIGGSINGPGYLHVRVTKCGKNSQLQKVIKLVKESQINKAPIQRYSDYIAAKFVPAILTLAAITFTIWIIICYVGSKNLPMVFEMEENGKVFVCLKIAISVIVVACPCALGLASPTAVMVGTGLGAENGALIKGGDVLENAYNLDILLFDKTGTLTTGKMSLHDYKISDETKRSENDWWRLIGSLEENSEHPIAKALVSICKKKLGLFEEDSFGPLIKEFKSITGSGVQSEIVYQNETHRVIIGNKKMFEQNNIDVQPLKSSNTVIYVVVDSQFTGYIELMDELKPNAKFSLQYLRQRGYVIGMVTGDNQGTAKRIGQELGIPSSNIFSEVSPTNKDMIVRELRTKYQNCVRIAFIGDGINDAPALSQADVGIAIANGTDISIESADIVLMNEKIDLLGVACALDISKKTFQRIKLNFLWATVYNMIMIPFAMGCFLPFNIMLPPIAASLAMAFSSVSVVISSLLLKRWKPKFKLNDDFDLETGDFDLKNSNLDDLMTFKSNGLRRDKKGYRFLGSMVSN